MRHVIARLLLLLMPAVVLSHVIHHMMYETLLMWLRAVRFQTSSKPTACAAAVATAPTLTGACRGTTSLTLPTSMMMPPQPAQGGAPQHPGTHSTGLLGLMGRTGGLPLGRVGSVLVGSCSVRPSIEPRLRGRGRVSGQGACSCLRSCPLPAWQDMQEWTEPSCRSRFFLLSFDWLGHSFHHR